MTTATVARRLEPGAAMPEPEDFERAHTSVGVADTPAPREEDVQEQWAALAPARPNVASFGNLFDPRLRLTRPLEATFEEENDLFIAKLDELDQCGYGRTRFEALDDLRRSLTELYWTLKENQANLAPGMQDLRARLGSAIVER